METLPNSCLPEIMPAHFYSTSVNMRGPSAARERSGSLSKGLQTAVQDETLTRPSSYYVIFIDARNPSLLSNLFGAVNKSDIKVSLAVSGF